MFTDRWPRRGERDDAALLYNPHHRNRAGPIAMLVGMGLSIWLFSNQTKYVGVVPEHWPSVGDITFEVGFVVSAVGYAVLFRRQRRTQRS